MFLARLICTEVSCVRAVGSGREPFAELGIGLGFGWCVLVAGLGGWFEGLCWGIIRVYVV